MCCWFFILSVSLSLSHTHTHTLAVELLIFSHDSKLFSKRPKQRNQLEAAFHVIIQRHNASLVQETIHLGNELDFAHFLEILLRIRVHARYVKANV